MFEIKGKYNNAIVFTDLCEEEAMHQILELCNHKAFEGNKIRIMPDVHAGVGCTIGTTMTITDKIVPNLVGVDIGCGMLTAITESDINLKELDDFIRSNIPSGQNVRDSIKFNFPSIYRLKCRNHINETRALQSIGTLGGGNHFIEIDVDSCYRKYFIVHTGSRYLGKQVAEYYQNLAYETLTKKRSKDDIQKIIDLLKAENRQREISEIIKNYNESFPKIKKELAYLEGQNFKDYLHDMKIVQEYAKFNREVIIKSIFEKFNLVLEDQFETIHNYIDINTRILRKGAVASILGQPLLIPINMRDGCLICTGLSNPDWNYSAPHGAGRIMSRSAAKEQISLDEFKSSMKSIYSTSVNENTIDESPMAYKSIDEIISNIKDTIDSNFENIKPIYNFKSS